MEDPIIACDVSKGSSHIQGFIGLSNPVGNPFVVRHLKSDLKLIKELAKSLEKQAHKKPKFVFEFTGIYHECITKYVQSLGLDGTSGVERNGETSSRDKNMENSHPVF